jgi:hypothetical protein
VRKFIQATILGFLRHTFTATPSLNRLPSQNVFSKFGAFSLRNDCLATVKSFQTIASVEKAAWSGQNLTP